MTESDHLSKEAREHIDEQTKQQSAQRGLETNQRQVAERKFNPSFLRRIQDADLDSRVHDWLQDEFPALFSGAQIIGQRSSHYEEQQEYLNRAKGERFVAESTPGALLQRHPDIHATMEGAEDRDAVVDPISTDEKRVVRAAMEVATGRQGLAVGARGLRSVTTATSETRTVRHEDGDEADGVLDKATGVFG